MVLHYMIPEFIAPGSNEEEPEYEAEEGVEEASAASPTSDPGDTAIENEALPRSPRAEIPPPASDQRVMLVTGASSGVGEHLVQHFAAKGWRVAAIARNTKKLEAACARAGDNAVAYPCDVSDSGAVNRTVAKILTECGKIDCCVNNAAVPHEGRKFWDLQTEDIDNCVDINLKGTMYVTHAVLQDMITRNSGFIFAIASVAGTWGIPTESCYVASKHGMVGFMDVIANETRDTNICVSTLCPGGIDTPWWQEDHPYGNGQTHANKTTKHLIQTQELVDMIDFQLAQEGNNRVFKRVVFFPKGEWHG